MNWIKRVFIAFLIGIFILGIFVYSYGPLSLTIEGMTNENAVSSSCPDLLLQKGNSLLLYNTKLPMEDGKNPLPFFNLDEYIHYLEIHPTNCPVLYLQQETNTQGEDVYRIRPSPFELEGGLPTMTSLPSSPPPPPSKVVKVADASRENTIYNTGQYAGFDPYGQYVGVYTNIDKIHDQKQYQKISDDPMDPNWAGNIYTQQMVNSGKYDGSKVSKPVLYQPTNTTFNPAMGNPILGGEKPRDLL